MPKETMSAASIALLWNAGRNQRLPLGLALVGSHRVSRAMCAARHRAAITQQAARSRRLARPAAVGMDDDEPPQGTPLRVAVGTAAGLGVDVRPNRSAVSVTGEPSVAAAANGGPPQRK